MLRAILRLSSAMLTHKIICVKPVPIHAHYSSDFIVIHAHRVKRGLDISKVTVVCKPRWHRRKARRICGAFAVVVIEMGVFLKHSSELILLNNIKLQNSTAFTSG